MFIKLHRPATTIGEPPLPIYIQTGQIQYMEASTFRRFANTEQGRLLQPKEPATLIRFTDGEDGIITVIESVEKIHELHLLGQRQPSREGR